MQTFSWQISNYFRTVEFSRVEFSRVVGCRQLLCVLLKCHPTREFFEIFERYYPHEKSPRRIPILVAINNISKIMSFRRSCFSGSREKYLVQNTQLRRSILVKKTLKTTSTQETSLSFRVSENPQTGTGTTQALLATSRLLRNSLS